MNRQEENRIIIDFILKEAEAKLEGTYNEIITFQLGAIATMLTDISKKPCDYSRQGKK